jgi:hypothetical protein
MIFDDRVRALAPLGFSPRQTRFLVTVALHGGFCLRRHYAAFARLEYGKHVREFLDALVTRELARRVAYKRNRGFIYHVHAKSLYRAIQQEDNRNRRVASPALIARKLMLLDLVIATPDVEWFATEDDKVALFTTRCGVTTSELPQRSYESADVGTPATVRCFVHKLPIYLAGDPVAPYFVCLADGVGDESCELFLRDHARLLRALPSWTLLAVGPQHIANFTSSERAFKRFCGRPDAIVPGFGASDLRWYCQMRKAVEAHQFDRLSVPDIAKFRDTRRRISSPLVDALYEEWLTAGDKTLDAYGPGSQTKRFANARFETRALPYRYTQFGDLPGIS